MIHAKELLDRLGSLSTCDFDGEVFRATRLSLDPLTPSTRGGRWSPADELGDTDSVATLYTSCVRDGALAELAFHYSQLTPFPSKPVMLHRLHLTTKKTLRLLQADLLSLGVVWADYPTLNYVKTQQIGAAVAFLGCDGLIAPSARWACENLMLFPTNHAFESELRVARSEEIALKEWARQHEFSVDEGDG
jgi:RES domain